MIVHDEDFINSGSASIACFVTICTPFAAIKGFIAIEPLGEILGAGSEGVRVRAAVAILNHAFHGLEILDLPERVDALEVQQRRRECALTAGLNGSRPSEDLTVDELNLPLPIRVAILDAIEKAQKGRPHSERDRPVASGLKP